MTRNSRDRPERQPETDGSRGEWVPFSTFRGGPLGPELTDFFDTEGGVGTDASAVPVPALPPSLAASVRPSLPEPVPPSLAQPESSAPSLEAFGPMSLPSNQTGSGRIGLPATEHRVGSTAVAGGEHVTADETSVAQGTATTTSASTESRSARRGAGPGELNSAESSKAMRNAGSLGGSLLVTTAIGFVVSIVAGNILGEQAIGRAGKAESYAGLLLGLLSLGIDFYIRKEVAVRPDHAKEFVPGSIIIRALLFIPIVLGISFALRTFGQPGEVIAAFLVFAVARYILQTNDALSACLHAVGIVRGLPRQNMISKIVASAVVLIGAIARIGAMAIPLGVLAGEAIKLFFLVPRVGERLDVWSQPRRQIIRPVLRSSIPFLTIILVTSFANQADVAVLGFLVSDNEVGFYKRAQSLTLLAFIVGTVLPWVILPMASRAAARSRRELSVVMRRSMELVLVVALPLGVLLSLHADTVMRITGRRFLPSTNALRILALSIIITYVATIANTLLQSEGRTWVGVRAGIIVVVSDVILVSIFARWGVRHFGDGGAGTMAAISVVIAETLGTALLVFDLGPRAWDRRGINNILRMIGALIPVVIVDQVVRKFVGRSVLDDVVRMGVDGVVFLVNVFLLRVINVGEMKRMLAGEVPGSV